MIKLNLYDQSFSTFSIKSATQCDFFPFLFKILFCHYLAKWVSLFYFLSHHYLASSESPQSFASIFGRIFPFPDWLIIYLCQKSISHQRQLSNIFSCISFFNIKMLSKMIESKSIVSKIFLSNILQWRNFWFLKSTRDFDLLKINNVVRSLINFYWFELY